jgi:hypothetical protein
LGQQAFLLGELGIGSEKEPIPFLFKEKSNNLKSQKMLENLQKLSF